MPEPLICHSVPYVAAADLTGLTILAKSHAYQINSRKKRVYVGVKKYPKGNFKKNSLFLFSCSSTLAVLCYTQHP